MKKSIFLSLLLTAALMVCGRSIIMKIEMKDGTVRYLDTEQVDEFNFLTLDKIPEQPVDRYITEDLFTNAIWLHDSDGVFPGIDHNVLVTDRYVPNDPIEHEYTICSWGKECRQIKFYLDDKAQLDVPCQPTGYTHPTYGPIWVADFNHYYSEVNFQPVHDARRGGFDGSDFNLYLVYYAPEYNNGTEFAQTATEKIFLPDRNCITISASLPSKSGDQFEWDVTLTDKFGFLSYAILNYAWLTDDFYSSEKYPDFIENFPSNAAKIEFDNGSAHLTVKGDSIDTPCLFLVHLYDREGVLLNDTNAPQHGCFSYNLQFPMGIEYAPDHYICFGNVQMDLFNYNSYGAYLSYVSPDEANGVERHLVLNLNDLYSALPNNVYNIYFTDGITPDENGHIPVHIRPHNTGGKVNIGDGTKADMFVTTQDQFVEKYGYPLNVHQSYYDINRNELMLYNVYYCEEPLGFVRYGDSPDFFSPDRTLDEALQDDVK